MYDLFDSFKGIFDIEFIGDPNPRRIEIVDLVVDAYTHPIILNDVDGVTTYNWVTIIKMTKVEEQ